MDDGTLLLLGKQHRKNRRLLAKRSLKHSISAMSLSPPTYQRVKKPLVVDGSSTSNQMVVRRPDFMCMSAWLRRRLICSLSPLKIILLISSPRILDASNLRGSEDGLGLSSSHNIFELNHLVSSTQVYL
jgi:hypothetical protein